jgi:hypothetical protein
LGNQEGASIIWSDYVRYRAALRGFAPEKIDHILRYSEERYFDTMSRRSIVIGWHDDTLVLVPYKEMENMIMPVTIHATTRQQVNFRLKTGRFIHG